MTDQTATPDPEPNWTAGMRERIDDMYRNEGADAGTCNLLLSLLDLCERRNLYLPDTDCLVDLFGYGKVRPAGVSTIDREVWLYAGDLAEPAGLDPEVVTDYWREEYAEGDDADLLHYADGQGVAWFLPVLNWEATMRLFVTRSPWAKEVMDALMPAFRGAMVNSGLGDDLAGIMVEVDDEGNLHATGETKTMSEMIRSQGPVPSREEARRAAFAGPAGSVDDLNAG
ncbi:hypothetical protein [Polymorphospora rubra]|uniref:Uncharacterized protein n=1 Tax=Polymorphospora rubra TaxID=338584 RepID=A0A810MVE6_9ACTN|nr:hypothetical protein [Polymorphospora rubra]BCJ65131.1 hypothetical protein Prubr_21520 [Polymorphospora rubra]